MTSSDFHGRLPAGRYFLGDPGFAMRPCLFQTALEMKGDARHAIVMVEDAPTLLVRPSAGRARYPNSGLLNLSAYDCESGFLGLVHESLLVDLRHLLCAGSMTRIVGSGQVSMEDGLLLVSDDVHPRLVRIETVRNRVAPTNVVHAQFTPIARQLPLAA